MQTFWVGMLCMIISHWFKLRPVPWQLCQTHTSASWKTVFIQFLQLNLRPTYELSVENAFLKKENEDYVSMSRFLPVLFLLSGIVK